MSLSIDESLIIEECVPLPIGDAIALVLAQASGCGSGCDASTA
jgi:hypothetical protein